jgi:O-antigen/teichoic acid export membrane protein
LLPNFTASVHVFYLLVPGIIVGSILKVLASDFNGRGLPLRTFWPAAISFGFALIVGSIVIPRFGIAGAAVVTSCGYAVNAALYLMSYSQLTSTPIRSLVLLSRRDMASLRQHVWIAFCPASVVRELPRPACPAGKCP